MGESLRTRGPSTYERGAVVEAAGNLPEGFLTRSALSQVALNARKPRDEIHVVSLFEGANRLAVGSAIHREYCRKELNRDALGVAVFYNTPWRLQFRSPTDGLRSLSRSQLNTLVFDRLQALAGWGSDLASASGMALELLVRPGTREWRPRATTLAGACWLRLLDLCVGYVGLDEARSCAAPGCTESVELAAGRGRPRKYCGQHMPNRGRWLRNNPGVAAPWDVPS